MKSSEEPIVVSAVYACPIDHLWTALTSAEHMVEWYFEELEEFRAEVGFKTQFPVVPGERKFTHVWEVTEVEPLEKICYNWHYVEYPGKALTCFELAGDDSGCALTVSMSVQEDFPDDIAEFTRESGVTGWEYFLNEALMSYLSPAPEDEQP